ncbi:hypothetical protein OG21DRAFT_1200702 [Imleria badia]|nr:hypothetical protein OG21DRAFT_1200702 [Imleria badia]
MVGNRCHGCCRLLNSRRHQHQYLSCNLNLCLSPIPCPSTKRKLLTDGRRSASVMIITAGYCDTRRQRADSEHLYVVHAKNAQSVSSSTPDLDWCQKPLGQLGKDHHALQRVYLCTPKSAPMPLQTPSSNVPSQPDAYIPYCNPHSMTPTGGTLFDLDIHDRIYVIADGPLL